MIIGGFVGLYTCLSCDESGTYRSHTTAVEERYGGYSGTQQVRVLAIEKIHSPPPQIGFVGKLYNRFFFLKNHGISREKWGAAVDRRLW